MKPAGHDDGTNTLDEKEQLYADVTLCSTPKRICAVNRTNLIKNLRRKYITRSTKSLQDRYLGQCINGSHLTDHFNVKGLFIVYSMWTPGARFPPGFCSSSFLIKEQNPKKKTWSSYTGGNCLGISEISSFHQETLPTIKPRERTYLVSWLFSFLEEKRNKYWQYTHCVLSLHLTR